LEDAVAGGAKPSFLSFPDWGGSEPLGWLAPWTPSPFEKDGVIFGSAEHHLMYSKAILFGDQEVALKILRARLPYQAREWGRRVRGFSEATWAEHRERIIFETNQAKFVGLPALGDYLVSTWPQVLVQASALDAVWSSGLDLEDRSLPHPAHWPGLNLVGFSLMRVRENLRCPSR
jgi:ribA/ribD-fused uncharacterized protein